MLAALEGLIVAAIGIGIIGFMLYDYWGDQYRDRPWYHDRDRWAHRPHPAPRPVQLMPVSA